MFSKVELAEGDRPVVYYRFNNDGEYETPYEKDIYEFFPNPTREREVTINDDMSDRPGCEWGYVHDYWTKNRTLDGFMCRAELVPLRRNCSQAVPHLVACKAGDEIDGGDGDGPKYHYVNAPWEPSTVYTMETEVESKYMALDGGHPVSVTGFNLAKSPFLKCSFVAIDLEDGKTSASDVMYTDWHRASYEAHKMERYPDWGCNGHTAMVCDAAGSDLPGKGTMHAVNPRAVPNAHDIYYQESALELDGDQIQGDPITVCGTAHEGKDLELQCPDGMRLDHVLFASYGTPSNKCKKHEEEECDGSITTTPCDCDAFEVSDFCHSDTGKPAYWTIDVVEKHCLGRTDCVIPANNDVFGNPCGKDDKWLSVAMRCSDRWEAKDYVIANDVLDKMGNASAYSFGAWVYPHQKQGVQAVMSFGSIVSTANGQMNRGLLQWKGMGNTGVFYYYDDCINDVVMKMDNGKDLTVASNQWYFVAVTVDDDNEGKMYLNGFEVAHFATCCRPDVNGTGTFIIGMDLDDMMIPKEYFDGLIDEVRVFDYAVPQADILANMTLTLGAEGVDGLVAYYRFNENLGKDVKDTTGRTAATLAHSSATYWNADSLSFNATGAKVHPTYSHVGVPWFPATITECHVTDETAESHAYSAYSGPLSAGTRVSIEGINFAPQSARVFYNGTEIPSVYVSDTDMMAVLPGSVPAEHAISVSNGPADGDMEYPTCEEPVTYEHELLIEDLAAGLCGFYKFEGNAHDLSGKANDGDVNGATLTLNRDNFEAQAYRFTDGDYISVSPCTAGEGFTVAAWVYYADADLPGYTACKGYELTHECQASANATMNGAWKFVAVSHTEDATAVYLNGYPIAPTSHYADVLIPIATEGQIGGAGFAGMFDDVWVYSRVLHPMEVEALYFTHSYALEFMGENYAHVPVNSMTPTGSEGLSVKYTSRHPGSSCYNPYVLYDTVHTLIGTFGNSTPFDLVDYPEKADMDNATLVNKNHGDADTTDDVSGFTAEYTGYLYAPADGEYRLYAEADDEVKLSVDGYLVIDGGSRGVGPVRVKHADVKLNRGWVPIEFVYTELGNGGSFHKLMWKGPGIHKELIPRGFLRSISSDFTVTAWIYPYEVEEPQVVLGKPLDNGINGLTVGIADGKLTASIYVGCNPNEVPQPHLCNPRRELKGLNSELSPNEWHFIAVQYNGTEIEFFVDGIFTDSVEFTGNFYEGCNEPKEQCNHIGVVHKMAVESELLGPNNAYPDGVSYKGVDAAYGHLADTRAVMDGSLSAVDVVPCREPACPDGGKVFEYDFYAHKDFAGFFGSYSQNASLYLGSAGPNSELGYRGLIYSVNLYNSANFTVDDMTEFMTCPRKGQMDSLVLKLDLNEGNGPYGFDTAFDPVTPYESSALLVPAPKKGPFEMWVNATCATFGTAISEVHGTALVEAIAGECAVFSLQSYDKCGYKMRGGGDHYSVEIVGPLHLHTGSQYLEMGDGIADMGDGSYQANFNLTVSGYYMIYIAREGEVFYSGKTYVHPSKTDLQLSYLFDDDDDLEMDELKESMAGVPVAFKVQTVDSFGNLRSSGGDTEWDVTFDGPVAFKGQVVDNMDGSYTISYNAKVPGQYKMAVSLCDQPLCSYGGGGCCGGPQSSLAYCSLSQTQGHDCTYCITVHAGSSLKLDSVDISAVFPDTDKLDLEGAFTIQAWADVTDVHDMPTTTRQYVLSKQSDYSGKGYWMAVYSTDDNLVVDVEVGLYIGAEQFRIVKAPLNVTGGWTLLTATYSGQELVLYGAPASEPLTMLKNATFYDEMPKFQKRNSQPLKVSVGFHGAIDSVKIFDHVMDIASMAHSAHCPSNVEGFLEDGDHLIAYYRFNENGGFGTKDSSNNNNDGIVGLICDHVHDGSKAKLSCPDGYVIGEILYANFGGNEGTCGAYTVDECASPKSMAIVENLCKGQQSCSVHATTKVFGNPCKGSSKSLAINAVCVATDISVNQFSVNKTAPSWVGVADTSIKPQCPFDIVDSFPEFMREVLLEEIALGASCEGWDMDTAVAGSPKLFAIMAMDGCGFRDRSPDEEQYYGTLSYASEIDSNPESGISVRSANDCYPLTWQPNDVHVERHFGGDAGAYCGEYNDAYLFWYVALDQGEADFIFQLGDDVVVNTTVAVSPGKMSAKTSTVEGPALWAAETGLLSSFTIFAIDGSGNPVKASSLEEFERISINATGPGTVESHMRPLEEVTAGTYEVTMLYGAPGAYAVSVSIDSHKMKHVVVNVTAPTPREAVMPGVAQPSVRFEHSMVEFDGDYFVFGGAAKDKTYLNELWKLDMGEVPVEARYSYRTPVKVTGEFSAYTMELTIDTKALIEGGFLQPDCDDVLFLTKGGDPMKFWTDPMPGCGSTGTIYWVHVPEAEDFYMYYGSSDATSNALESPVEIFGYFEDFEYNETIFNNSWILDTSADDSCSAQPFQGTEESFYTSAEVALVGSRSLKVDTSMGVGGSVKRDLTSELSFSNAFVLKGYMYDSGCAGSHWISPDFEECEASTNDKSMLPLKNGLGIQTTATKSHYATTYPWASTHVARGPGWHSMAFYDDDTSLTMLVDDVMVEHQMERHTIVDKVFLHGGQAGNGAEWSAYWDAIFITRIVPGAKAELAMGETEAISYTPDTVWEEVSTMGTKPPARQAHSAVVFEDGMYIYGGERSSYEYTDVWMYSFTTKEWSFVSPAADTAPARHDHSAVVYNGAMYVYGGRSPKPLGDMWKYSFADKTWTSMPVSKGMAARFGHSAVVAGKTMIVYGGYVHEQGVLSNEIWEFDLETEVWTQVGPRHDNFMDGDEKEYIADPKDAIIFPAVIPAARFSHVAMVGGSPEEPFMFMFGGAGGASMKEALDDLWKYDIKHKEWTQLYANTGLARYDAAVAGHAGKGPMVVFGGHGQGMFLNDVEVLFIGDGTF